METILRNHRALGAAVSFLLHAAVLFTGGLIFTQSAEYAVESGSGGIEISLVAAPAAPATSAPAAEVLPEAFHEEIVVRETAEIVSLQEPILEQKPDPKTEAVQKLPVAVESPYRGDGSSAIPGKDQTTFYSAGGAITEAKPNYLRNPAPAYPLKARQNGWQGTVILKVDVDKSGRPAHVDKEQSSGFGVLDDSALRAVKKWKFMPARIGGVPVESTVRVPVKFEIES